VTITSRRGFLRGLGSLGKVDAVPIKNGEASSFDFTAELR
jgi:hypothetical protein